MPLLFASGMLAAAALGVYSRWGEKDDSNTHRAKGLSHDLYKTSHTHRITKMQLRSPHG
jgi:hypothetical protein